MVKLTPATGKTRTAHRTHFHKSAFTRSLAHIADEAGCDPAPDVADALARWLDFTDAIKLYSAHNEKSVQRSDASTVHGEMKAPLAHIRSKLEASIARSFLPDTGNVRIRLPQPVQGIANELAASYEPYRRFYMAYQREMDSALRPIRSHLRNCLTATSPTLAQLVALDAALEEILSEHESRHLSTVPALLEKRFDQLRADHLHAIQVKQLPDTPATWMTEGEWLATFCGEMRDALMAELDLRMLPALGLIEAHGNNPISHINE